MSMTIKKFACRFCGHDQSQCHNLIVGCTECWCAATPGEALPRTDDELDAEILPPGQYRSQYVPTTTDTSETIVTLVPELEDIRTVNEAWKHVECSHFKDPTTACLDCQAKAVLIALHQAGWRKTQ